MISHALAAVGVTTGGLMAQALAAVADATPAASDLSPWLQGGGSVAAVGGLVYVARMIVRGELVPAAVSAREQETAAAIRLTAEREQRLQDIVTDCQAREVTLSNIGGEAIRGMARQEELHRQLLDELRWWRERRPTLRRAGDQGAQP